MESLTFSLYSCVVGCEVRVGETPEEERREEGGWRSINNVRNFLPFFLFFG